MPPNEPRVMSEAHAKPPWLSLPVPAEDGHKYDRGHAVVVSGGPWSTGAARLAATAALRAGAGLVTLASPGAAMMVNASHLTAVMLARADDAAALAALLGERRIGAVTLGMGLGLRDPQATRAKVLAALGSGCAVVADADALTAFADDPAALFAAIAGPSVLTPHEGEFARLFGPIEDAEREEAARGAASESGAVVVLKGPRTVVAASDGRCHINDHASPWLATAGSGDVLAGIVLGLLVQGMEPFEAARAAVWLHGDAGRRGGPGLVAEDLPGLLPPVLRDVL